MKKKYVVTLTEQERRMLRKMISQGNAAARKLMHAHILLKADQSKGGQNWEDAAIAQGLDVGTATVERVCENGLSKKGCRPLWIAARHAGSIRTNWMVTVRPI